MKWEDVLPERVAQLQRRRERRNIAIVLRQKGVSKARIAEILGITEKAVNHASKRYLEYLPFMAKKITRVDRLKELHPIEVYFIDDSDVRRLARLIKRKMKDDH